MPLSDRDYIRPSPPPPRRRIWSGGGSSGSGLTVLWVIMAVNLVIFIITKINREVVAYLGLIPGLLSERPWTILTSMFVHSTSDFWHILFNMLALYFFGRMLVMLTNVKKFLLVYLIGGLAGNALFMVLNTSSNVMLIGASGAVYAIAGALVVMVPRVRVALWGVIPMPLWVFVVVFLVILALPPFVDIGVAWQAHMGGLAAGLIAGFIFRRKILPPVYYR